jgi:hypothetical protein
VTNEETQTRTRIEPKPRKPPSPELALGVYAQDVTNQCKTKANFQSPRLCRQPERVAPLAKRQSQSQFPVMSFDDAITLWGGFS